MIGIPTRFAARLAVAPVFALALAGGSTSNANAHAVTYFIPAGVDSLTTTEAQVGTGPLSISFQSCGPADTQVSRRAVVRTPNRQGATGRETTTLTALCLVHQNPRGPIYVTPPSQATRQERLIYGPGLDSLGTM